MPTIDQILAGLRHFVSFVMGLLTAFGVAAIYGIDLTTIGDSFEHIFNGIKEIAAGAGPLASAVMAYLAARRANPIAQVKRVAEMPEVEQVVVRADGARADPALVAVALDASHPKIVKDK